MSPVTNQLQTVNSNGEPHTLPASYAVVFMYQYSTNLPPIGVGTGGGQVVPSDVEISITVVLESMLLTTTHTLTFGSSSEVVYVGNSIPSSACGSDAEVRK